MPRKNLTGQRFGMLTVLREGSPHVFPRGTSERTWVCRCDCGGEITATTSRLTGGLVTHCGCQSSRKKPLPHARSLPSDLTGRTFGDLEVLSSAGSKTFPCGVVQYLWNVRCRLCGRESIKDGVTIRKAQSGHGCGRSCIRVCRWCGKPFQGGLRAEYCPECRVKERRAYQNAYHKYRDAPDVVKLLRDRNGQKGLVQRKCKKCGLVYWTKPGDSYLCPKCAEESRKSGVLDNRTCETCGATFLGYPRSKYCPACRKAAQREANRRCKERKKAGTSRPLGSTDMCQHCGKPYIVTSGLQRYCPDCAKEIVPENIRQHKRDYMAENRERFNAHHQAMRSQRRVCVICGKTFDSPTNTTVCSADCAAEQLRRSHVRAQVNAGRAKPIRLLGPRGPVHPQSGIPGVHYHPGTGKWELVLGGQHCGLYDTVAAAAEARKKILEEKDEKSD